MLLNAKYPGKIQCLCLDIFKMNIFFYKFRPIIYTLTVLAASNWYFWKHIPKWRFIKTIFFLKTATRADSAAFQIASTKRVELCIVKNWPLEEAVSTNVPVLNTPASLSSAGSQCEHSTEAEVKSEVTRSAVPVLAAAPAEVAAAAQPPVVAAQVSEKHQVCHLPLNTQMSGAFRHFEAVCYNLTFSSKSTK